MSFTRQDSSKYTVIHNDDMYNIEYTLWWVWVHLIFGYESWCPAYFFSFDQISYCASKCFWVAPICMLISVNIEHVVFLKIRTGTSDPCLRCVAIWRLLDFLILLWKLSSPVLIPSFWSCFWRWIFRYWHKALRTPGRYNKICSGRCDRPRQWTYLCLRLLNSPHLIFQKVKPVLS